MGIRYRRAISSSNIVRRYRPHIGELLQKQLCPLERLVERMDRCRIPRAPGVSTLGSPGGWHHHFRSFSVPLDLASQPFCVVAQDPVRHNRALVPILDLPENSPELFVDQARARVRDRNHFACIRYLKSVGTVVESDEPKVICLLSFIRKHSLADRCKLFRAASVF